MKITHLTSPDQNAKNIDAVIADHKLVQENSWQPSFSIEALKNKSTEFDLKRKTLTSQLSPIMYTVSSIYHVAVGAGLALNIFDSNSAIVKNATRLTKLFNSLIYGDLAIDACKQKNSFDFLSKLLEPFLNCVSQLSNYHLLRGLGSAMTQLHIVNLPHIKRDQGLWENFIQNIQLTRKFFVEAWTSGLWGKDRRLFKFKEDKGHTLAWLSHIQAFSSILGLLNGTRRNLIDKIVGTVRNAIGVGVDLDLLNKKDIDEKNTGRYYLAHALFDTVKRFIPKDKADVIDNLAMPLYNKAMYHFGKLTRKQSDGTYVQTVDPVEDRIKEYTLHQNLLAV